MYYTNKEYRQALRIFFNMNTEQIASDMQSNEYDDETYDELLFDEAAVNTGMSDILEKTNGNHLFDELYSLAAAKFLSTSKDTGICILFTYNFFPYFVDVWNSFQKNPEGFLETDDCFVLLKERLTK